MAITRTQIAKQLLAQGGRIGLKGGADAATASFGKSVGYSDPKTGSTGRPDKDFNPGTGGGGPTFGDAKASQLNKDQIKQARDFRNIQELQNKFKFPSTIQLAKGPINKLMSKQLTQNRIDFLKSQYPELFDEEEGFTNLPGNLQDLYEKDKLYTDDALDTMMALSGNDMNFADFMYNVKGSPGLKLAGNVGGLGVRSAVRDADGNIIGYKFDEKRGDGEGSNLLPQGIMAQAPSDMDQEPEEDEGLRLAFRAEGGPIGGEYDFDSARQMYGLGKLVKKVTRTVKKIAKSPVGKAALLYAGGAGLSALGAGSAGTGFGMKMFGPQAFASNLGMSLGKLGLGSKFIGPSQPKSLVDMLGGKVGVGILGASALAGLLTPEQEEEAQALSRGEGIDIEAARRSILNAGTAQDFRARRFVAEGGSMKEPVAKKTMPLLDMGGKEMDLRAEGGFVPIGRMEKADDVPARLSKNEFVFTADAVRNAGDGDVDKGAEVMYNMMKNLEAGGEVSEESQGLEGARKMFQTSQRLEEVL